LRLVPEGRCDRGLARSAWKNATQKSRPVGYGVIEYEGRPRGGLGQDAKQIPEEFRDGGLSLIPAFGSAFNVLSPRRIATRPASSPKVSVQNYIYLLCY
jgi:hypothetical protein